MQPTTSRGRRMRRRILETAADLMHTQGVEGTSLDEVLARSGAGKGQFYHYFENKSDLVQAVLRFQMERALFEEMPAVGHLDSWTGIRAWFDLLIEIHARRGFVGGCPVGSMAAEMADRDDTMRAQLTEAFRIKRGYIEKGLVAMRDRGALRAEADPVELASFTIAAIQGGLLLSTIEKTASPLRAALAHAYAHLRSWAA